MGLRGPAPKADHLRQRRNKPKTKLVLRDPNAAPPAPPAGMLVATRQKWATYWQSDLALTTRDAHLPMIERLFMRYDERARAFTAARKRRLVIGSQGQLVLNPLLKYVDKCDAEIRMLEDRLGLSPRTMAQLGSGIAKAQKSLDDMNESLETDDEIADANDTDPRIVAKIG